MIMQLEYGFAAWSDGSSFVTLYYPDGRQRGMLSREDIEKLYAERWQMPGASAPSVEKNMVVQLTDLEEAKREVVEAARELVFNIDHGDRDLLAILRRKVNGLVMIEKSLADDQP